MPVDRTPMKGSKNYSSDDQNISSANLYPGYSDSPNKPKPNTSESAETQDIRSINNSFDPYYQPIGDTDTSHKNLTPPTINSRKIDEILQGFNDMAVATPTIPISIKYTLEAVPTFDGHNIPLSHFLKGCQEAEQMIFLRNKLRREARRAVHGVKLNTITEFTAFLKSLYAPAKSIYQLQGELGRVFQGVNEAVLAYANRVKEIGHRICEAYETANNGAMDDGFKTRLDLDLVDCFIHGLLPDIENKITLGISYEKTMHKAIGIERNLRAKDTLRGNRVNKFDDYDGRQQYQKIHHVSSQGDPITCQICDKKGHAASSCFRRLSGPDNSRNMRPPFNLNSGEENNTPRQSSNQRYQGYEGYQNRGYNSNTTTREPLTCRYCKNLGHVLENCWKREHNNQQARNRGQEFTQPRGSSQSYRENIHKQTWPSTSRDPPQLRTVRYLQPEDSDNRPKRIATALINRDAPTIRINSEDLTQPISLMIDTGASLNLIKIGRVAPHVEIDRSRVLQIRGITKTYVDTLGKAQLRVMGSNIDFHLVDNEFPIEDDGLIGNEFFLTRNADVSYSEQCLKLDGHKIPFWEVETVKIPARTKGSFFVRVQNFEATEGYVPRQQVAEGIFLGDALVTNNNGKAYLYLTNTTEKDIEVAVPVITIEPYEELLNTNSEEDLYINSLTEPVQENNQAKTKPNTESFDEQSQPQNLIHQVDCNETMEPTELQTPESSHYPTSHSILPSNSYSLQITEPQLDEKLSHQNHGILQYLESCKENVQLRGKELDEAVLEFQGINKIVQEITDLEKTLYSTRTSLEKNQVSFSIYSSNDRVAEIKKLLRLDHLNQEEKESVDRHLNEFQDRYHLSNEKLMATSVMRHRINTTDERPINTRKYRYPPVLEEEINRQVETLLDDGIIQPSQSAYNSAVWIVQKRPTQMK